MKFEIHVFQLLILLYPLTSEGQTITVGSTTQQLTAAQRGSVETYWPDGNMGALVHSGTNYVFGMTANPGSVQTTVSNLNTWSSGLSLVNPSTNFSLGSTSSWYRDYIGGSAVYYDASSGYPI